MLFVWAYIPAMAVSLTAVITVKPNIALHIFYVTVIIAISGHCGFDS